MKTELPIEMFDDCWSCDGNDPECHVCDGTGEVCHACKEAPTACVCALPPKGKQAHMFNGLGALSWDELGAFAASLREPLDCSRLRR